MSTITMNTFESELVGLDKTNTINAYYSRDLATGLFNSNIIVSALKKLGYYSINYNEEEEIFIKSKIIAWIKTSDYLTIVNTNISNLITTIKSTQDYTQFSNRINQRIQRFNDLNQYINIIDTYDFYSSLTLEELNHLGY